jgi:DNA-binding LacI/PurR family transcriptional regulator
MITIYDIAEKAQVSVATISRLLNKPEVVSSRTAKKIFQIMEELNYQPNQIARSLTKKRTNTIGVIISDVKNTFINNWYRFIENYAESHNFNLILCNTDQEPTREMKYIKLFQSQRVDGIIISPSSKKSVEYLIKSNIRFVLFNRVYKGIKADFVTTNHYKGAYELTEYLIKQGHKRIAVLKGAGILYFDIERYCGFEDAMKKHRIKINSDLILNCEFNETKALHGTEELLYRENKPTAIFSFNSFMTLGAIRAIQNMNLSIPKDISIVCFDEIPGYTVFQPRITHVLQPIELLGKNIMSALIGTIKNQNSKNVRMYLNPNLVIGNSCRKI